MLIAATGHRPDKLGGYGRHDARLEDIARGYLSMLQPAGVITGMALGWDTRFALAALSLGLPLHAAVPFNPGAVRGSHRRLPGRVLENRHAAAERVDGRPGGTGLCDVGRYGRRYGKLRPVCGKTEKAD